MQSKVLRYETLTQYIPRLQAYALNSYAFLKPDGSMSEFFKEFVQVLKNEFLPSSTLPVDAKVSCTDGVGSTSTACSCADLFNLEEKCTRSLIAYALEDESYDKDSFLMQAIKDGQMLTWLKQLQELDQARMSYQPE